MAALLQPAAAFGFGFFPAFLALPGFHVSLPSDDKTPMSFVDETLLEEVGTLDLGLRCIHGYGIKRACRSPVEASRPALELNPFIT